MSPSVPKPKKKSAAAKKRAKFARVYGGAEYHSFITSKPCSLAPKSKTCCGAIVAHHTRTGGTSRESDARWLVPLCDIHHGLLHQHGQPETERVYGVDLKAIASELWDEFHAVAERRDTE